MRILRLEAVNFRTVEQIEVNFQNYYTSICGKNNSGKSNLLRVIRNIFIDSEFAIFFGPGMRFAREIDIEKDFTNWKSKEKSEISICVEIEINSKFDSGLYKFIEEFILKNESSDKDENACLKISISWKYPERKNNVEIVYKGEKIEDSYQKDEIIRKIKSINCMIFHNSTSHGGFTYASSGRFDSIYEFLSDEDKAEISKKKDDLFKQMKSRLKKQQKEFATLLGRLEDKYEVSLSFAEPSFERSSINISLKE